MTKLQTLRLQAAFRQKWCCFYCGLPTWENDVVGYARFHGLSLRAARKLKCTAEHLIARQDGGLDTEDNIVAACWFCNNGRHRSKKPKSAAAFGTYVRSRILRFRWHSPDILASMLAHPEAFPPSMTSQVGAFVYNSA